VRSRRLWLVVLAALVAVVAVGLKQASETNRPRRPTTGTLDAAEIRAKLAGAPPALASLHRQANVFLPGEREGLNARLHALRGYPVVVNVWAAWCGPCREELPVLQRASLDWGDRVGFVGVDLRDNRGSAERLLRQIPVSYPSFEDPDGKIASGYRLVGTPSTIYYDAAGQQTYVHQGPYVNRSDLDADIARYALGERS
jgi:cytochrome c biogenesis protein CcmG/thiol:disulfide interchange protein DsbE